MRRALFSPTPETPQKAVSFSRGREGTRSGRLKKVRHAQAARQLSHAIVRKLAGSSNRFV